jgi:hypothetical protein
MESAGVGRRRDLDARTLAALTREHLERYRTVTGKPFPENPLDQVEAAVRGVLESWDAPKAREYRRLHDLPDTLGTAVILQRMVFGNAGGVSSSGVGFTRGYRLVNEEALPLPVRQPGDLLASLEHRIDLDHDASVVEQPDRVGRAPEHAPEEPRPARI